MNSVLSPILLLIRGVHYSACSSCYKKIAQFHQKCSLMRDCSLFRRLLLKFVFFEKATKFDEISILLLTNKFVFFVSRYSFELQSLFVWFSVLKLNSLRWLLVYKLSQCLKHSKHCQNLAMFGMFE